MTAAGRLRLVVAALPEPEKCWRGRGRIPHISTTGPAGMMTSTYWGDETG